MASINQMIQWFKDREGKVNYSQSSRLGPTGYDCSSAVYFALIAGGFIPSGSMGWTGSLHDTTLPAISKKISRADCRRGDIFLSKYWANEGHTGVFLDNSTIIHCNAYNGTISTTVANGRMGYDPIEYYRLNASQDLGIFTLPQYEVAKVVWGVLKQSGYSDHSAAGVIGNLYAESSLDPNKHEVGGGGGYGLGQWTPRSNLYTQATICGISAGEAETAQGQAKIIAQGDKTGQWLVTGNTAYHPTVQKNQTLAAFKQATDVISAAANFCAHWERPKLEYAHMDVRIRGAQSILQVMRESNLIVSEGEVEMKCLYQIDEKGAVYYFDGTEVRPLTHMDEKKVLQDIYQANNGKEMPFFKWTSSAPWHYRLKGILERPKEF
ncbi:phage tail tip lysozyme [Enterococcus sp. AZ109]|uniref:phage tail tip lysozyme n=1 Tax=Enterococcus sp. AZ109 TaxID=2774634 RepID=UPI003F269FA3